MNSTYCERHTRVMPFIAFRRLKKNHRSASCCACPSSSVHASCEADCSCPRSRSQALISKHDSVLRRKAVGMGKLELTLAPPTAGPNALVKSQSRGGRQRCAHRSFRMPQLLYAAIYTLHLAFPKLVESVKSYNYLTDMLLLLQFLLF